MDEEFEVTTEYSLTYEFETLGPADTLEITSSEQANEGPHW